MKNVKQHFFKHFLDFNTYNRLLNLQISKIKKKKIEFIKNRIW